MMFMVGDRVDVESDRRRRSRATVVGVDPPDHYRLLFDGDKHDVWFAGPVLELSILERMAEAACEG